MVIRGRRLGKCEGKMGIVANHGVGTELGVCERLNLLVCHGCISGTMELLLSFSFPSGG
jgi:hypothetical protein